MENKKWYNSWTIWFNLILLAVDVVNQLANIVPIPAGFITFVGTIGNLALRYKTSLPIK